MNVNERLVRNINLVLSDFSPAGRMLSRFKPTSLLSRLSRQFKTLAEYDKVSNETLDRLFEDFERLGDSPTVPTGFDVEFNVLQSDHLYLFT